MERILEQIRIWKNLPAYQAERRIDIFFGVFMKKILIELGYFSADEDIVLIPEFPQPTLHETKVLMSVKIDYIAASTSKLYAIELKTDAHSIRKVQKDYYNRFLELTWGEHRQYIDKLEKASRAKKKYKFLQQIVSSTQFPNDQKPTKVIYIGPDNTVIENTFNLIKFSDIASLPVGNDKLFELFKDTLKNWNA